MVFILFGGYDAVIYIQLANSCIACIKSICSQAVIIIPCVINCVPLTVFFNHRMMTCTLFKIICFHHRAIGVVTVSYTHLTLPTIYSV